MKNDSTPSPPVSSISPLFRFAFSTLNLLTPLLSTSCFECIDHADGVPSRIKAEEEFEENCESIVFFPFFPVLEFPSLTCQLVSPLKISRLS